MRTSPLQRAMEEGTQLYLTDLDPLTRRVPACGFRLEEDHVALCSRRCCPRRLPRMPSSVFAACHSWRRPRRVSTLHENPVQQVIAGFACELRNRSHISGTGWRPGTCCVPELPPVQARRIYGATRPTLLYILDNPAVREAFFPDEQHTSIRWSRRDPRTLWRSRRSPEGMNRPKSAADSPLLVGPSPKRVSSVAGSEGRNRRRGTYIAASIRCPRAG